MRVKFTASPCAAGTATTVLFVAFALCGEPLNNAAHRPDGDEATGTAEAADEALRVPVAVARERAELMHRIYAATLEVLHHRYFHDSRAMVHARAMEDIFDEIARQSQVEAKWMVVNMRAMSSFCRAGHQRADEGQGRCGCYESLIRFSISNRFASAGPAACWWSAAFSAPILCAWPGVRSCRFG